MMYRLPKGVIDKIERIWNYGPAVETWGDIKSLGLAGEVAVEIISGDIDSGDTLIELNESLEIQRVLRKLYHARSSEINSIVTDIRDKFEEACVDIVESRKYVQDEIMYLLASMRSESEHNELIQSVFGSEAHYL